MYIWVFGFLRLCRNQYKHRFECESRRDDDFFYGFKSSLVPSLWGFLFEFSWI